MRILTNKLVNKINFVECVNTATKIDEKERSIIHTITTNEKNRNGQIINPDGMNDAEYSKNPVVLWMHGSILANTEDDLPIGRSAWRKREGNGIIAKTIFHDLPFASDIFYLNKEGFLNAWSIGFQPAEDIIRDRENESIIINKWNLFEYSSVTIPANANALNNMLEVAKTDDMKNSLTEIFAVELLKKEIEEIRNKLSNGAETPDMSKFVSIEQYNRDVKLAVDKISEIVNSFNKLNKKVSNLVLNNLINKCS